jgi:hypothetical protein
MKVPKVSCSALALAIHLSACAAPAANAPSPGVPVDPRRPSQEESIDHPERSTEQNIACGDGSDPVYEIFEKTTLLVKCPSEGVKWKVVCRRPPSLTKTADGGVKIHCS